MSLVEKILGQDSVLKDANYGWQSDRLYNCFGMVLSSIQISSSMLWRIIIMPVSVVGFKVFIFLINPKIWNYLSIRFQTRIIKFI